MLRVKNEFGFTYLLTQNAKLSKNNPLGIAVYGMAFAPAGESGNNVCPHSGACRIPCVTWQAGRTSLKPYRKAAIARTRLYFDDRPTWRNILRESLALLPQGSAVRLNVASDLPWERLEPWIFEEFPHLRFYDYTKWPIDKRRLLPSNYALTYSSSEKTSHHLLANTLTAGRNVAVVLDSTYLPQRKRYGTIPVLAEVAGKLIRVVDGDVHDLRLPEVDGSGVVIALRGKGSYVQAGIESGFIRQFPDSKTADRLTRSGKLVIA